jgi:hypothetical protein
VPAAGLLSRAAIAAAFMLLAAASCASAGQRPMDRAPYATDATTKGSSPAVAALLGDSSFSGDAHQHGGTGGHLPASRANVALVGKLTPTSPFGAIVPGQIADIAVYKDYAYLSSWSESTCTKGGVYVADIRNLRKPKQLGFIPALPGNFHGEGAQAISVATKAFSGNLLVSNNEFCTDTPTVGGGFDLYDVTDPAHPHVLVQGAGDRGGEGEAERQQRHCAAVPQHVPVEGRRQGLSRRLRRRRGARCRRCRPAWRDSSRRPARSPRPSRSRAAPGVRRSP